MSTKILETLLFSNFIIFWNKRLFSDSNLFLENLPFLLLANFTGNDISWIHPR